MYRSLYCPGHLANPVPDDDTVLFFNYRSDRVRQITQVLGDVDRSVLPDYCPFHMFRSGGDIGPSFGNIFAKLSIGM